MLNPYQAKALSVAVLDDNEHRLLAKRAIQLKAKSNFKKPLRQNIKMNAFSPRPPETGAAPDPHRIINGRCP